jgi:hypothetical protein
MNNKKLCPIMGHENQLGEVKNTPCLEGRCAWYYNGHCAVVELAVNTGDIQGIADMLDMKGGIQE